MNGGVRQGRGFSLLELVIALAILGLLAGMAAPLTETVIRRGKEQELKTALYRIRDAIDAYKRATDAGFIEKSALGSGYPPSLAVLVEGVRDLRNPSGSKLYFLRRIPRDPFAEPDMSAPESWGLRSYDSSAENPQEGEDVFDVYSLSKSRGLNGIPYREW
ncbi:general secretion pathway protein G [Azotobacter beijerinckii]|uniref:General secretion pathway protein G n=1 Tax=Azotobacter beijerinckii TaxID=170623 RepID=A0A1H6S828_9GAMM|nr:type II secretion system protein [Azotobacter beijerinckii]SEI60351.1 general secretion pathway protein G [Azotobacter beijerinckii]SEI64193.1 general secretion pathway protein G [Azotobacter beijerinckii]